MRNKIVAIAARKKLDGIEGYKWRIFKSRV